MKLARIADPRFHAALDKLAMEQLPIKVTFKLKTIAKSVQEKYKTYEEVRQAALAKYGKKDENGQFVMGENQTIQFDGDNLSLFVQEINELVNEEIEMPTIKISELGDKLTMSLADLEMLDGLIVEE